MQDTYIHDLLAQLGEHNLDRVGVGGSSPSQVIKTAGALNAAFLSFFIFDQCLKPSCSKGLRELIVDKIEASCLEIK
jgi:hypothetical protein